MHKKGLWFDEKDDDDETNVQEANIQEKVIFYLHVGVKPVIGGTSQFI